MGGRAGGVCLPFYVVFGVVCSLMVVLQIIERSLPKKQKLKKDPSVIEREEMEKIGKVWVNIVRRDMPKHHRIFTTFHRKQLIDAKRVSENCQREVLMMCMAYVVFYFFLLYCMSDVDFDIQTW